MEGRESVRRAQYCDGDISGSPQALLLQQSAVYASQSPFLEVREHKPTCCGTRWSPDTTPTSCIDGPGQCLLPLCSSIYLRPYCAPARYCTPADSPHCSRAPVESIAEHPRRWRPSHFSPTTATTTLLRPPRLTPPDTRSSPSARSPPRPRICPHPSHSHTRIALLLCSYSQSETLIRAHLRTSKTPPIRAPAQ